MNQEIKDRLEVLYRQEVTFYLTTDYLGELIQQKQANLPEEDHSQQGPSSGESIHSSNSSKLLNQHWREVMCEWAYHVVDHFDFPRDIVSACMSLLDRYLARYLVTHPNQGIPKQAFQLLAMTCLYIAVKLDQPKMLSLETMAHLSRGTFTKEQMRAMEMDILTNLQWHVHPPTPYIFLSHFMQISSKSKAGATKVYEMARYFVELSVLDYYFVGKRSSTVAIAALLNALEDQRCCFDGLDCFVLPGHEEHVQDCRARLRSLYNPPNPNVFGGDEGEPEAHGRTASPTGVMQM